MRKIIALLIFFVVVIPLLGIVSFFLGKLGVVAVFHEERLGKTFLSVVPERQVQRDSGVSREIYFNTRTYVVENSFENLMVLEEIKAFSEHVHSYSVLLVGYAGLKERKGHRSDRLLSVLRAKKIKEYLVEVLGMDTESVICVAGDQARRSLGRLYWKEKRVEVFLRGFKGS